MLLMFVVGTGSLGWMLVLAAVMAAEKNLPGGDGCARRWVSGFSLGPASWRSPTCRPLAASAHLS